MLQIYFFRYSDITKGRSNNMDLFNFRFSLHISKHKTIMNKQIIQNFLFNNNFKMFKYFMFQNAAYTSSFFHDYCNFLQINKSFAYHTFVVSETLLANIFCEIFYKHLDISLATN